MRILYCKMHSNAHIIAIICAPMRILYCNMRSDALIIAIICAPMRILYCNMRSSVHKYCQVFVQDMT